MSPPILAILPPRVRGGGWSLRAGSGRDRRRPGVGDGERVGERAAAVGSIGGGGPVRDLLSLVDNGTTAVEPYMHFDACLDPRAPLRGRQQLDRRALEADCVVRPDDAAVLQAEDVGEVEA